MQVIRQHGEPQHIQPENAGEQFHPPARAAHQQMLEIPPAHPIEPTQKRPPHAPGNAVIRTHIGGIEDQFASQRRHVCSPCLQMWPAVLHSCQAPTTKKISERAKKPDEKHKHAR